MKISTLLQSSLLAAGLLLGGTSAVHADREHATIPSGGHNHSVRDHGRSYGHTPQRFSGHHIPGRTYLSDHGKHYGKHKLKHHENHGQGHGYGHEGRWKYGKHDGRGYGRDHKGHWQHGTCDARYDAGRKGHRTRSGGIGYTGRS